MTNEKRLIDAYLSGEVTKIKTPFAEIIVSGATEKPYYNIMFFDPAYKEYEVCFGSYCLEHVRKWLSEEFEIVDAPTVDAVEVVHGRWEPRTDVFGFVRCSVCHDCNIYDDWEDGKKWNYCPHCGAKMDGDGNEDEKPLR
jgi:hypothetical protein